MGFPTLDFSMFDFSGDQPKGLKNFINEIRTCESHEEERTRVDKELGNIRLKFSQNLTAYHKRKYVWKLCYIHMLGYDVDFGHDVVATLIASPTFQEKSVGYMAATMLLSHDETLLDIVLVAIRNDLKGEHHYGVTLALHFCANYAFNSRATAEAFTEDVCDIIKGNDNIRVPDAVAAKSTVPPQELLDGYRSSCRRKALLALLRCFQLHPEIVDVSEWSESLKALIEAR